MTPVEVCLAGHIFQTGRQWLPLQACTLPLWLPLQACILPCIHSMLGCTPQKINLTNPLLALQAKFDELSLSG